MSRGRIRVAAYVIRRRQTAELLIFEQAGKAHAGAQIPAGGVRPGETPEQAVLREVYEEAGLSQLRSPTRLVTEDKPHPLTREPRCTTFFAVNASPEPPHTSEHVASGDGVDAGMTFRCRWAARPLPHPLADDQDAWLGLVDPRFITICRNTDD